MIKGSKHTSRSRYLMSEAFKKRVFEGRGWVPIKEQHERHDYLLKLLAKLHKGWGATILYIDLPGHKRPDIIYYKDGKIVAEDIKTNGDCQIDGEWTVN